MTQELHEDQQGDTAAAAEPVAPEQAPTVPVTNLDQFVAVLADWHATKVNTVKHMLAIPVGTLLDLNEEKDLVLEGDLHKGFMIGLTVALSELGELPFTVELEDAEAPTAANEPAATPAN